MKIFVLYIYMQIYPNGASLKGQQELTAHDTIFR